MSNRARGLYLALAVVLAAGCETTPPMAMRQAQAECRAARAAQKHPIPYSYTSELAMIADRAISMAEKVATATGTDPCDQEVLAFTREQSLTNRALISWGTGATYGLIGWGVTNSLVNGLTSGGSSYTLNASDSASISDVAIGSGKSTIGTGSATVHGIGDQQQAGESLIGRDSNTRTDTTTTNTNSLNNPAP